MIRRLSACLVLLFAASSAAEPHLTAAPSSDYELGARVGGYGFRREGDKSLNSWNECRMNGVGIFAGRALRGPWFVEAGLDAYFSSDFVLGSPRSNLPVDRTSGLLSVAAGLRSQLAPWLRGYVQLGAGVELTRLAVPYGEDRMIRDTRIMPEGFFGLGLDLRIARGTYVGATFRTLVMGNFDYDRDMLEMGSEWVAPSPAVVFDATPDLAAQGQFYVRRDL